MHWIGIAERFNIIFGLALRLLSELELSDLSAIPSHLVSKVQDLNEYNPQIINKYSNLKKLKMECKLGHVGQFKNFTGTNVLYSTRVVGDFDDSDDSPNKFTTQESLSDILFNNNTFTNLNVNHVTISSILRNTTTINSNLRNVTLYYVEIHPDTLFHLFENSPNLTKLLLNNIVLTPLLPFNMVLESLPKLKSLQNLYIEVGYENYVSFQSIVTMLNTITVSEITIKFIKILYESVDHVFSSEITNTSIKNLKVTTANFHPYHQELNHFKFLQIWKDKSHIETFKSGKPTFDITHYLDDMVALKSLIFDEYSIETRDHYFAKLVQSASKITSLSLIKNSIHYHSNVYNPVDILQNHSLTSLSLCSVSVSNAISILDCKHPTITTLSLHITVDDILITDLIPVIQSNTTLTSLELIFAMPLIPNEYDRFDFLTKILKVNRTLESIKLPQLGKFKMSVIQEFKEILFNNRTIKRIHFPFFYQTDTMELLELFNRYFIVTKYFENK
ncbi:hypothetical protein DLAC_04424 [Tieghemostelium lacteum]|uniref:Uncharacterized protein n=1 Tax=Tieghemostelium lacteum TaxID=361077 RepID=A0A151ZJG2_TIELA|nr:hypothetical protein DLAC_04424 [Tieghemostelium lacteum]|eukprot:KYQ94138.1 hypothetical protein DLAC_04424 [Tieghemostelium lacteum]